MKRRWLSGRELNRTEVKKEQYNSTILKSSSDY